MILTDEQKKFLEQAYELMKDYCVALVLGGSAAAPYIRNPHDIDVIIVCNSFEDKLNLIKECLSCKATSIIKEAKEKYGISFVIQFKEQYEKQNKCSGEITRLPTWLYLDNTELFGSYIIGDLGFNLQVSVLDHKERYYESLLDYYKYIQKRYSETGKLPKWYSLLIGLYILQNNSYELTEEQLDNVNIVHDNSNCEKAIQLFNELNLN